MLIDAAVAVKCFGVATGYLITISDSMVNAFHHMLMAGDIEREETFIVSLVLSRYFWVCGAILSVLPLSFYRTLDELKKASALALVFVFMLVGMILAYANGLADPCAGLNNDDNSEHETCKGDIEPYTNFSSTISKLPIFVFAFSCHQNIFPIVNELELLSQKRLNIVITCSIGFALFVFSTVAMEGYRTFGSVVRGDILMNYPENRQVTFLRICISGMLALHYPLQLDPSRRCITSFVKVMIKWWCQQRVDMRRNVSRLERQSEEGEVESYVVVETEPNDNPMDDEDDDKRTMDDRLFYIITFVFISSSFILAMIVDDLGIVLALVGSTGSTLVSYVLPGLIYIKVAPQKDAALAMAYVQLCLGLVLMPLTLYYVITKAAHH
jgi:amino acid permease